MSMPVVEPSPAVQAAIGKLPPALVQQIEALEQKDLAALICLASTRLQQLTQ